MKPAVGIEKRIGVEPRLLLLSKNRPQIHDVRFRCAFARRCAPSSSQTWRAPPSNDPAWRANSSRTWRIVSLISATMRSNEGAATLGLSPWLISIRPIRLDFAWPRGSTAARRHSFASARARTGSASPGRRFSGLDHREQAGLDEFGQLGPRDWVLASATPILRFPSFDQDRKSPTAARGGSRRRLPIRPAAAREAEASGPIDGLSTPHLVYYVHQRRFKPSSRALNHGRNS